MRRSASPNCNFKKLLFQKYLNKVLIMGRIFGGNSAVVLAMLFLQKNLMRLKGGNMYHEISSVSEFIKHINFLKDFYSENVYFDTSDQERIYPKYTKAKQEIINKFSNLQGEPVSDTSTLFQDNKLFYFRGQSNYKFNLVSSSFRSMTNLWESYNVEIDVDRKKEAKSKFINEAKKEEKIMKSVLGERPESFSSCNTMFEKLTIMQHYGIPTRIMDLTGNPLIALYFACEDVVNNPNVKCVLNSKYYCPNTDPNDGSVFLFCQHNNKICDFNSDKVRLLSNLSLMEEFDFCGINNYFDVIISEMIRPLYEYINIIFSDSIKQKINKEFTQFYAANNFEKLKAIVDNELGIMKKSKISFINIDRSTQNDIKTIYNYITKHQTKTQYNYLKLLPDRTLIQDILCEHLEDNTNISNQMISNHLNFIVLTIKKINELYSCDFCSKYPNCKEKLLDLVRSEKTHFEDRIKVTDLNWWYVVRSIKNNPRIQQQDGNFIITPNKYHVDDLYKPFTIETKRFDTETGAEIIPDVPAKNQQLLDIQYSNDAYIHKIKIPASSKEKIINELANMGINHSTIYPELHEFAKYIKYKFNV